MQKLEKSKKIGKKKSRSNHKRREKLMPIVILERKNTFAAPATNSLHRCTLASNESRSSSEEKVPYFQARHFQPKVSLPDAIRCAIVAQLISCHREACSLGLSKTGGIHFIKRAAREKSKSPTGFAPHHRATAFFYMSGYSVKLWDSICGRGSKLER